MHMRSASTERTYHLMLLPGLIFVFIFSIVPMFGLVIAFERFIPTKGVFGSAWVGLKNFQYLWQIPDGRQVLVNTVIISVLKIIANTAIPLVFALLLNEVRINWFKRAVQTVIYLPHFLSWVILGGIVSNILSLDGIINTTIQAFGGDPVLFLADNRWFRPILVFTDVWKEFGFGTIVYLAALTAISPNLYESAMIDRANRFQQMIYITLPSIAPTIVLLLTLSLGNVLNAGFDQVFNLYNPLVYETADIIDTYVYRIGIENAQYGLATAVGLMKSVVSFGLIILSYRLASRYAGYRIF
jgi:putative aldouronate transport system permease protein